MMDIQFSYKWIGVLLAVYIFHVFSTVEGKSRFNLRATFDKGRVKVQWDTFPSTIEYAVYKRIKTNDSATSEKITTKNTYIEVQNGYSYDYSFEIQAKQKVPLLGTIWTYPPERVDYNKPEIIYSSTGNTLSFVIEYNVEDINFIKNKDKDKTLFHIKNGSISSYNTRYEASTSSVKTKLIVTFDDVQMEDAGYIVGYQNNEEGTHAGALIIVIETPKPVINGPHEVEIGDTVKLICSTQISYKPEYFALEMGISSTWVRNGTYLHRGGGNVLTIDNISFRDNAYSCWVHVNINLKSFMYITSSTRSDPFIFQIKSVSTTTAVPSERQDILCETDTITAFIPVDLLPAGAHLTWRDPNCTLASNSSHFLSTISHNQCGTSVSLNTDSVVFENEILLSSSSNVTSNSANSMVDFGDTPAVIPVKCVYPRKQVSVLSYQPIPSVVRFYEKRNGQLEIKMEMYKSNQFQQSLHDLPLRVRLQSDVNIRVSLGEHSDNIGLRLEKCIATNSPVPYHNDVYTLIENGCPVPSHVKILPSPSTEARFSFKAFEFVSNKSAQVYIHCEASVCQAGSPDCAVTCRYPNRLKRDLSQTRHSHLISTGPLVLEANKETNLQVSTILAGVFAVVAVGAIIVAVVGWRRKPVAKKVDDN